METIRELINKAQAKGNDVLIADEDFTLEQMYGGGWTVIGELGWNSTEEEVDQMRVIDVEELEEGITIINVVTTGW